MASRSGRLMGIDTVSPRALAAASAPVGLVAMPLRISNSPSVATNLQTYARCTLKLRKCKVRVMAAVLIPTVGTTQAALNALRLSCDSGRLLRAALIMRSCQSAVLAFSPCPPPVRESRRSLITTRAARRPHHNCMISAVDWPRATLVMDAVASMSR